jgi:hypothetical protein
MNSLAVPLMVALCLLVSILLTVSGLRVVLRGGWTWWAAPVVLLAELLAMCVFILLTFSLPVRLHPFGAYNIWLVAHSFMDTFCPRPFLVPYLAGWKRDAQTLFIAAPPTIGLTTSVWLYFLVLPWVTTYAGMVAALFTVSLVTATTVHLLLAMATLPRADNSREHFRLACRLLVTRFKRLSIGALIALCAPTMERLLDISGPEAQRQTRGMIMLGLVLTGMFWARRQDADLETEERQRLERRNATGKTGESLEGVTTI